MEDEIVACGKCSGESILLSILLLLGNILSTDSITRQTSNKPLLTGISGKRDLLKAYRSPIIIYHGPYHTPVVSILRRKFENNCNANEVPDIHHLSVLEVMLNVDAATYYTNHIALYVWDTDDVFNRMQTHFITPAHKNRYMKNGTNFHLLTLNVKNQHSPLHNYPKRSFKVLTIYKPCLMK